MTIKNKLAAAILAVGFLLPSIGQACQWVRVGELGDRLECRSNYRNFLGDNSELFNKLLIEAAYLGLGSAERITIDNWAIRNAVTVPEAHKLLQARFDADKMVNEMNSLIRQNEALDGQVDGVNIPNFVPIVGGANTPVQMPSAYMVGVTVPFNGDIAKIPFVPKMLKEFIPKPGGSIFLGWVLIPQKVEFVMNADGTLSGPAEYVSLPEDSTDQHSDILSSLLAPAEDESFLYDYNRIRLETRFVVIPSIDAKTGQDGKFKSTYVKPTIGMVFGRNIVKSHQVLSHGPSISIPGKNLRLARQLSYLGPFVFPNWLVGPVERYVDTIKVGYSFSSQDEYVEPKPDNIQQFNENTFVWLRFHDRLKRVRLESTAGDILAGKFRWGWFGVVGMVDDGEADNNLNGLSGDLLSGVGSSIGDAVKGLLSRSEEQIAEMDPKSIKEEIEELEESLEIDDGRSADDGAKLPEAVRRTIEDRVEALSIQLDAFEAEESQ